jgi:purine-binding chemotaxis protein CheW
MSAMEDIGALARASAPKGRAGVASAREYLTFRLGAEEYAIDILKVQEIRGYENPTRIINAPHFVKGVVNLRGVIVPIIDLRLKFALESAAYDTFTVVIILNVAGTVVGVVVDAVSDVLALQPDQVKPAPGFDSAVDATFITGIGSVKDGDRERMLVLVDIERLVGGSHLGLALTH